jgi:hypothetical protein
MADFYCHIIKSNNNPLNSITRGYMVQLVAQRTLSQMENNLHNG